MLKDFGLISAADVEQRTKQVDTIQATHNRMDVNTEEMRWIVSGDEFKNLLITSEFLSREVLQLTRQVLASVPCIKEKRTLFETPSELLLTVQEVSSQIRGVRQFDREMKRRISFRSKFQRSAKNAQHEKLEELKQEYEAAKEPWDEILNGSSDMQDLLAYVTKLWDDKVTIDDVLVPSSPWAPNYTNDVWGAIEKYIRYQVKEKKEIEIALAAVSARKGDAAVNYWEADAIAHGERSQFWGNIKDDHKRVQRMLTNAKNRVQEAPQNITVSGVDTLTRCNNPSIMKSPIEKLLGEV